MCCLFISALIGCNRPHHATVFCAASLNGVVEEIGSAGSIRVHSDGSEKLVSQFQGGADVDLLLLADAALVKSMPPNRQFRTSVIAGNRLVLAASAEKPLDIGALSNPEVTLALADPRTAPLGRYSKQALAQVICHVPDILCYPKGRGLG